MPKGVVLESPLFSKQTGSLNAVQMARKLRTQIQLLDLVLFIALGHLEVLGTGTYDDKWLEERHPYYPKDFDDAHWNCAPEDQQFDFPDLMKPHYLIVENLTPHVGRMYSTSQS